MLGRHLIEDTALLVDLGDEVPSLVPLSAVHHVVHDALDVLERPPLGMLSGEASALPAWSPPWRTSERDCSATSRTRRRRCCPGWTAGGVRVSSPLGRQPDEAALDLEFAFTTWEASCRDASPSFQQCRRRRAHDGQHAAGFGEQRHRWSDMAT